MPALRVDSQFTLVEAALKGYVKWKRSHAKTEVSDIDVRQGLRH